MDKYDCLAPIDHRYWSENIAQYLSARAYTAYLLKVEAALALILAEYGICDQIVAQEIATVCQSRT